MKRPLTPELERSLLAAAEAIAKNEHVSPEDKLMCYCSILYDQVEHYDWVGFYLALPQSKELLLSSYIGAATEHFRIQYGNGICGQTAQTLKEFVVQDVNAETNYLSCSVHVKSEIVIPIFHEGNFVGELDIDSHALAPFGEGDSRLLKAIAYLASPCVAELSADAL